MFCVDGEWFYEDKKTQTVGNRRDCGHCHRADRADGHDACIGELPGVMNACCGHGQLDEAYVQFTDGSRLSGTDAIKYKK